ncbi:MAG: ribonuclease III [Bacteroidota bacterium]
MRFLLSQLFSTQSPQEKQLKKALYTMTGLRPGNLKLYKLALQHRSVQNGEASNERLEFLGDAVLSLIIGEYLFKKYPYKEEGFLTEIRSRIVNRASLGRLAKKIGVHTLLQYDKSVLQGGGRFIYGNALEALIGAVYLDKGYKGCQKFVLNRLLHLYIDLEDLIHNDTNYKSRLVTWANRNRQKVQFEIIAAEQVQGRKEFTAHAILDGQVVGQAQGSNKKQAEQNAALVALKALTEDMPASQEQAF